MERLIAGGRMTGTGLAPIEAAKALGTWTAFDEVEALTVLKDLQAALAKNKNAARRFAAFPKLVKRGILEWISNAKRKDTKAKRIAETVLLAAENKRAAQYRPLQ